MAYEKLIDLSTDTVSALGIGEGKIQKIEGFYLGARKVKVEDKDSVIHVFQTPKGNEGVWGTAKLNGNLTPDVAGYMLCITYKGKVKLKGGKTQHTYDFQIDKDQRVEVPKSTSSDTDSVEYDEAGSDTSDRARFASDLLKNRAQA